MTMPSDNTQDVALAAAEHLSAIAQPIRLTDTRGHQYLADEDEAELIERLEKGVPPIGMHEDNTVELFDIEDANEVMFDAARHIRALRRSSDRQVGELGLEWCEDDYSLRTPYDGDVNDDTGQHIVVGGETVITFADSDEGDKAREWFIARLTSTSALEDENARLREGVEVLEVAAKALLEACYLADGHEELSEHIDGSLLDAVREALEWRYPEIWTQDQVDALNASQAGFGHPFTCGGDRGDDAHRAYAEENGEDNGQLIATKRGWVCPVCDYRQFWAHPAQFEGTTPDPRALLHRESDR